VAADLRLDRFDGSGRWLAALQLRQGLPGVAGGLEQDDPDASRTGAGGGFTRATLQAYRLQELLPWLEGIARLFGQWASEPLVVSEQMSIGGHDSVRGYPPFEFMADHGFHGTVEFRAKLLFLEGEPLYDMLQLTALVDAGEGTLIKPAAGEDKRQFLAGAGVGLRFRYAPWGNVRLDVAWPLTAPSPSNDEIPAWYAGVTIVLN
jgi:hemolysin activation/secretion protein